MKLASTRGVLAGAMRMRCSSLVLCASLLVATAVASAARSQPESPPEATWARGVEGQRKADLGDGTYLNPILAGDHPDPSILKDGSDYYMVFSTFQCYPGLVLWHSRDLVNWQPLGPTLFKNVGPVWAPELTKHEGRYFIYFPGMSTQQSNYVIWTDDIRGPWSEPVDLKVAGFDPGHAVGADGRRYLFLNDGYRVELSADGLSVKDKPVKVYDGWKYPEDWVVAIRAAAAYPTALAANWLFQLAGSPPGREYRRGTWSAAIATAVVPTVLGSSVPTAFLWGAGQALALLLVSSGLALVTYEWLFLGFHKIPFTCSYLPGGANLRVTWPRHVAVGFIYSEALPLWVAWALPRPLWWGTSLIGLVVTWLALRRYAESRPAAQSSLAFEERGTPLITELDLRG